MTTTTATNVPDLGSQLTQGKLPRWAPLAIGAGALALSGLVMMMLGFNLPGLVVIAWLLFVPAFFVASRSVEGHQKGVDTLWKTLVYSAFGLALLPLVSVVITLLTNGLPGLLDPGFLSSTMQYASSATDQAAAAGEGPVFGGILHALIGSVLITLAATLISVPIGLLTSIYLVEYATGGPLARAITFFVDVMTGIPSIVAGLFGAALLFSIVGPQNSLMGFTAAVALSVLMIPVVVRSTVEMLRVVPNELREASYALGVRKWRTIVQVVLPTAISGIASGVTLAIARVIGETAPILVTAGVAVRANWNLMSDWMMTLPVYIYRQLLFPTAPAAPDPSIQRAWGAALVLIILVMGLNLAARLIAKSFAPKTSGR